MVKLNVLDVSEGHVASQMSRDHFASSLWESTRSFSASWCYVSAHRIFFSCHCRIYVYYAEN